MKDYKVFLARNDETWTEAIQRYHLFCEADMKEYFSNKDYSYRFADNRAYRYQPMGKVSLECVDDFTLRYKIKVPSSLIDLMCNHGVFRIGDSLLEIYDDIGADTILTLPRILSLYGYSDFIDLIKPGILKSLLGYYFFFGVSFPHSPEMSFLYFNKAGVFGKMLFAPNNNDIVLQKVLPSMFNGSADRYTLDSLISNQIDRVITNALTVKGYID